MGTMNLDLFRQLCAAHGLPEPVAEYRFCERRWRLDFAWLAPHCVALEVDGGAFSGGRHTRGKGFLNDIEKLNAAVVMGWRVVRATPQQVQRGDIFPLLQELLTPAKEGAA
jgi:hypothetical protein